MFPFYFDQHGSTLENKARFVSWRGEIWPRTKRELEAWRITVGAWRILNTGINFPRPCYRGRSTVTAFSFDKHRPLYRGNAIFILQGKTRMLRPRMLMVSKDRNENEGRIKLCSNYREFRLWRLVSLRRGRAFVSWKKIVYRRAYIKLTLKLSITSFSSIEKNFVENIVWSRFTAMKNLISFEESLCRSIMDGYLEDLRS